MRKLRVLIAVQSPALFRVIQHLLDGRSDLDMIGLQRVGCRSEPWTAPDDPDVIVLHGHVVGEAECETMASARAVFPRAKLLFICGSEAFSGEATKYGADACLPTVELVAGLIPAIASLMGHATISKRPRSVRA